MSFERTDFLSWYSLVVVAVVVVVYFNFFLAVVAFVCRIDILCVVRAMINWARRK